MISIHYKKLFRCFADDQSKAREIVVTEFDLPLWSIWKLSNGDVSKLYPHFILINLTHWEVLLWLV